MKARVLKRFNDGWEKCTREVGEIIEVPPDRFKYFNSTHLGEVLKEVKENKNDEPDLETLTKKEIIEYAEAKGIELDERMTKKEMIKGLM